MDVFDTHYYKLNKLFLSIVGLWPSLDAKTKRIRVSFVVVVFAVMILGQLFKCLTANMNVSLLVEILSNIVMCFCVLIVYITAYVNEGRIKKMIDHIRIDWTKIESKEEHEIFKKYAKETRIYTLLLLLIFYTSIYSIFFFMLLPVLLDIIVPLNESRHYDIPFPIEMFFDTSKYFHISFSLVFVSLNVMGSVSIAVFPMVLIFLQHGNGLFDLVGHIFENMTEGDEEGVTTNDDKERKIYERLKRGVWFHERTIKYIAAVNSICQTCYLIEVVLVGAAIGVDLLRILQVPFVIENAKEIVTCMLHIDGNLIWILINCYFGQKVIDRSSNVYTKVCNSKWYTSSTKAQKLILLIIVRSMKPSHVSIGKIFVSSLEFFVSIIQTSISYAMVFYSLRQ